MPSKSTVARDQTRTRYGMIHGRFQPFHNGHLDYALLALERCETLIIGITNPDPTQTAEEEESIHRHTPEANPYTFFQRLVMIRDSLLEAGVPALRFVFIPFPVNLPDLWRYYVPDDAVHYIRIFSEWEQAKVDRLREYGYRVEHLQPGVAKLVEATEVRRRMMEGENWQDLVPPAVARALSGLGR